jgi:hypothetical protein
MKPTLKFASLGGLVAGLVLATASVAQAQVNLDAWGIDPSSTVMRTVQLDKMVSTRSRRSRRPVARPATRDVSLVYSPSASLRQKIVRDYVNRLRGKNPAASDAIEAAFGPSGYDYSEIYNGLNQSSGLGENDATDVLSAYLILGYRIVNNVQDNSSVTVTMTKSVRSQVAALVASNARLSAPGVAAQVGEELKLQTVLARAGWQGAIRENRLADYQQGIAALYKRHGMDLSQLRLTEQGFARR